MKNIIILTIFLTQGVLLASEQPNGSLRVIYSCLTNSSIGMLYYSRGSRKDYLVLKNLDPKSFIPDNLKDKIEEGNFKMLSLREAWGEYGILCPKEKVPMRGHDQEVLRMERKFNCHPKIEKSFHKVYNNIFYNRGCYQITNQQKCIEEDDQLECSWSSTKTKEEGIDCGDCDIGRDNNDLEEARLLKIIDQAKGELARILVKSNDKNTSASEGDLQRKGKVELSCPEYRKYPTLEVRLLKDGSRKLYLEFQDGQKDTRVKLELDVTITKNPKTKREDDGGVKDLVYRKSNNIFYGLYGKTKNGKDNISIKIFKSDYYDGDSFGKKQRENIGELFYGKKRIVIKNCNYEKSPIP